MIHLIDTNRIIEIMGNHITSTDTAGKISFVINGRKNPFPLSYWIFTDGSVIETIHPQIHLYVHPHNKERLQKKLDKHKISYRVSQ